MFFLPAFLLSIALVNALCCDLGCYPDANRCCGPIGSQVGYIGCESSTHDFFCPDEILGSCLVCQCSDSITCGWYGDDEICRQSLGENGGCKVIYDEASGLPETSVCEIIPCSLHSAFWSDSEENLIKNFNKLLLD